MEGFPPSADKLVTKANMTKPPFNKWAFQHMRYLCFTAPIGRGTTEVTKLETHTQELLDKKTLDFVRESQTDALLVLHKGKIVTEFYDNGMTEQTPHYLASVTKSFTGTIADLLIFRGQLDPNKLVSDYIPELKQSGYGDATVRQVLDMEVGVAGEGDFTDIRKTGTFMNEFSKAMGMIPSCEDLSMYDVLPKMKSIGPNGVKFSYTSPTAEVAGWILSRAANKPLEVLIGEEIWSKLGTSGEAYTLVDTQSKMISTGGLSMTARDLARFGQVIASGNQQVLPPEVIKTITGGGNKKAWKEGEFSSMIPYVNSYHSYWYQTDNENHAVMAMGIYGQHLYIDPVNEVVIVKFGSYPTQYVDAYDDGWVALYPQIANKLKGKH